MADHQDGMTRRAALALAGAVSLAGGSASGAAFPDAGIAGQTGWVDGADGQRTRYDIYGAGSPTLILVHGWTCDRSYWNEQVRAFSTDYRVVTLDLVGHGDSDKGRTSWSMEGLGDDVARVVQATATGPVVLIGHSMGGPVVIEAARRAARSQVAGVVTIDILTSLDQPKGPKPAPLTPTTFRAEGAKMIRSGMFLPNENPEIADRIALAMTSGSPEIAIALAEALGRYDAKAGLAAIAGIPLTMIDAGNRSVDVAGLRAVHPKVRIFLVDGVGHFVMIDDPKTFDALLLSEVALMTGRIVAL
jgi:pimeloyl-ACP methyl ester carboxylesterase